MLKLKSCDTHFNRIRVHNVQFPSLDYFESTRYFKSENRSIKTIKLQAGSYIQLTEPMLHYVADLEFFTKTHVLDSVKWDYRMLHIAPKKPHIL